MKRMLGLFFAAFLIIAFVVNIIMPDRKMSSVENRSLQTFPRPSISAIVDGSFGSSLTDWYSDQFVGRNTFIHLRYITLRMMGHKKIDDVYLCHNRLIEENAKPNNKQLKRNLKAMNEFSKRHDDVTYYFMLIPNAVDVQHSRLPMFSNAEDQKEIMDEIYKTLEEPIQKIDVRETMNSHKKDYIYYKTDHHWTTLGAFYAYQQASKVMGVDGVKKSDYTDYIVSTNFKGTLSNKTGSVGVRDEIHIFVKKKLNDYYVFDDATKEKSGSMYVSKSLRTNDKYTVFLGGNKGIQHIQCDNKSDKHLLIIKDSYANEYVQFLLSDYRTITIVDPRYYTDDIERVIQDDYVTDVLFLYNTNTFVQDTSLADVLE